MIKSTSLCIYPQANCNIIASTPLLAHLSFFCSAWQPHVLLLPPVACWCFHFIQMITPCLINSTIILCVFDCMVHHWLLLYVLYVLCVFVRVCVWLPCAASPIIKVGWGPDWQYEMFRDGGDRKPSGTADSNELWLVVLGWGWAGYQISVLTQLCPLHQILKTVENQNWHQIIWFGLYSFIRYCLISKSFSKFYIVFWLGKFLSGCFVQIEHNWCHF